MSVIESLKEECARYRDVAIALANDRYDERVAKLELIAPLIDPLREAGIVDIHEEFDVTWATSVDVEKSDVEKLRHIRSILGPFTLCTRHATLCSAEFETIRIPLEFEREDAIALTLFAPISVISTLPEDAKCKIKEEAVSYTHKTLVCKR